MSSFTILRQCLMISLLAGAFAGPDLLIAQVSFNNDIRPILSQHCTACHGPDESSRQADLRLDTFEGATEFAIEPGDPDFSDLIDRVSSVDNPMPPAEHGERLTDAEIQLLRQWISEGAKYESHWSFVKPERPDVPVLSGGVQPTNPIDRFVLHKATQQSKATFSPQSDPARLIRRVALDLTGLPPSREMVGAFVADPSEANYEKIVEQLLADPAYGEHWASMWLDLARYADTMGYAGDETRTIWPWRDWLIKSLNENKSFDQFTIEILAGDLLPNATNDQKLATAFHRNTLNNNEGGTNDEEFRTIAVKDRISTTMNTWMGLTMRCAECHSHKYDPISHTEYHQFLDFFNQTVDADRGDEHPILEVRPESLRFQIEELDRQIDALRLEQSGQAAVWQVLKPESWETEGTRLKLRPDHSLLATGTNPDDEAYGIRFDAQRTRVAGIRIEVLPSEYHAGKIGRGDNGSFFMTIVAMIDQPNNMLASTIKLSKATADFSQEGFEPANLIRKDVKKDSGQLGWSVQHPDHNFEMPRFVILQLEEPIELAKFELQLLFNSKWHGSNPGRLRFSITSEENPVEKFKQNQLDPLERQIQGLIRQRNAPIKVPVLQDLPSDQLRTTHVMKRGNFQNLGEEVSASVPAAFHAFPKNSDRDRLGIANWLVDPQNPLTARVTVNRYWARLFGKGIVITEEDFGTQGTPPTHPELLDWLAIDFQTDWDVKRSLKQIVMSKTYRQTCATTPEQIESDPGNTMLLRGPRVRLPAETIRDQALAVSGLLSKKKFGPPVYPPNPIKEVVNAFKGADVWHTSKGEDRYRRSIYTFLKRSQPHPLFETFDTATRDVCSLRRINTNTPLQSFMTLNDEAFVEAAQALAKHSIDKTTVADRIRFALESALLHPASDSQINVLSMLYEETLESYKNNTDQAAAMIGRYADEVAAEKQPELAAMTVVANVILNLDEFLTH